MCVRICRGSRFSFLTLCTSGRAQEAVGVGDEGLNGTARVPYVTLGQICGTVKHRRSVRMMCVCIRRGSQFSLLTLCTSGRAP